MIYSLGLRLFSYQKERANDFLQSVYLHSFDKKDTFKGKSKFSTWLYSVALNYGLNQLKHQKKEMSLKTSYEEYEEKDFSNIPFLKYRISSSEYKSQEEKLIEKEINQYIRKELYALPEVYQICLICFYYEGLSYKKIAEKLGIKEGTVKSHIYRGKQILKQKIKGRQIYPQN